MYIVRRHHFVFRPSLSTEESHAMPKLCPVRCMLVWQSSLSQWVPEAARHRQARTKFCEKKRKEVHDGSCTQVGVSSMLHTSSSLCEPIYRLRAAWDKHRNRRATIFCGRLFFSVTCSSKRSGACINPVGIVNIHHAVFIILHTTSFANKQLSKTKCEGVSKKQNAAQQIMVYGVYHSIIVA